ncbi:MAG TPA: glycosyl hydrolase family 43, partial [Armatimonadota bacterium]|nr:glycosyl hydrolase family 43 [Armatimonadota bacterium]
MESFQERILPAPVGGGFAQAEYWVWCGSAIHGEDGRYHLFASRWPRALPFFAGYQTHSEIVRAVSDTPEGPYHFAEVVLPARGAEFWDG